MNNNSYTSSIRGKSEDSQFPFTPPFTPCSPTGPAYIFKQNKNLLNQITKYLRSQGCPVEKINKEVRGIDAADIATNINGKLVHIQLLLLKAIQSPGQWKYQKRMEECGDVYRLVRSISDFYQIYSLLTMRPCIDYTKPVKDENEAVAIMTNCQLLSDLKAFYLCNAALIDGTTRARNCYNARRAIIHFKTRQHG